MIRSTSSKGLAAVAVLSLISASSLLSANASTPMTEELCGTENNCSITASKDQVKQGETFTVDVVGVPGATVSLQPHLETVDGIYGPWGDAVPVTVGADGKASVQVTAEQAPAGTSGGWMLVLLADSPVTDWALGDEVVLLSEIPVASNFGEPMVDGKIVFSTFVQGVFTLTWDFGIEGQEHGLEIKVDGKWRALEFERDTLEPGRIVFDVPKELSAGTYAMRIKNLTTGTVGADDVYALELKADPKGEKPKPEPTKQPAKPSEPAKPGKDVKKPGLPKTGV